MKPIGYKIKEFRGGYKVVLVYRWIPFNPTYCSAYGQGFFSQLFSNIYSYWHHRDYGDIKGDVNKWFENPPKNIDLSKEIHLFDKPK